MPAKYSYKNMKIVKTLNKLGKNKVLENQEQTITKQSMRQVHQNRGQCNKIGKIFYALHDIKIHILSGRHLGLIFSNVYKGQSVLLQS